MNDQSLPLKRLSRLGKILKLFTETDKISSHNLGKTFNTTQRTIQRDLSFLKEAGFPLQDIGHGFYRLDKNLLGLDDTLESSANIWFSEDKNIEVKVVVDRSCAGYFKRRRIFPTQEIQKDRPDGSLLAIFRVGRYEEIEYILKSWLPNVSILEPEEFRTKFLNDLRKCADKHEEGLKE